MQNHYQNIKHIIWDWNGTLVDDCDISIEIINSLLEEYAAGSTDKATYRDKMEFPIINYYNKLGLLDHSDVEFEEVAKKFLSRYNERRHECALHSQAKEIIEELMEEGITHSVLSAYQEKDLHEMAEHNQMKELFLAMVGQLGAHAHSKVEQGKAHVEKLPYEANQILLIGDTVHDFEVAQAIGVQCLLAEHGHQSREKLEATGAPVISSLDEITRLLIGEKALA